MVKVCVRVLGVCHVFSRGSIARAGMFFNVGVYVCLLTCVVCVVIYINMCVYIYIYMYVYIYIYLCIYVKGLLDGLQRHRRRVPVPAHKNGRRELATVSKTSRRSDDGKVREWEW